MSAKHLTTMELEAGLALIRESPKDAGPLQMIVRRPRGGEREVLDQGQLDPDHGLVGDNWRARTARTPDGMPDPDTQLTVMNSRAIALVAQDEDRWPLAGDQLIVDLDLSTANMPPGTRVAIGSAVIEVSEQPHTGCGKFVQRFGADAMKFVNSSLGRELHLRGVYFRVAEPGRIRVGDVTRRIPRA